MPSDVGVVDCMIGFPSARAARRFDFLKPQLRDEESASSHSPISYMFKDDDPNRVTEEDDPVAVTLAEMDRFGIAIGLVGLAGSVVDRALSLHPDRFKANLEALDPNDISGAVRRIREAHAEHDIKAVTHVSRRLQSPGAGQRPSVLPRCIRPASTSTCPSWSMPGSPAPRSLRRARTSCISIRSATTSPTCASSCGTGPSLGRNWP